MGKNPRRNAEQGRGSDYLRTLFVLNGERALRIARSAHLNLEFRFQPVAAGSAGHSGTRQEPHTLPSDRVSVYSLGDHAYSISALLSADWQSLHVCSSTCSSVSRWRHTAVGVASTRSQTRRHGSLAA